MIQKRIFFFLFASILYANILPLWAQYRVMGVVTDSITGEPVPFTSVYLKGTTNGCQTDDAGKFSFETSRKQGILTVSYLGYREFSKSINTEINKFQEIKLQPSTYELLEVVVKPGREHYRKKDNPAVRFVKKIMEHKNENSPYQHDYYRRDRYDKITFAINNFTEEQQQKWLYRRFKFLKNYVDTSAITGKPVLTVSIREKLATDLYRKSPSITKQLIKAKQQDGIDELISQQGMQLMINEIFRDVDIYEPNISLFNNKFVSPLSSLGPSFYKYYLNDTVKIEGEKCVDLTFVPFNSQSFGFTGHLYVTLDSTYFVKQALLNFPKEINLNFVNYMQLEQKFIRSEDGTRLLNHEYITAELSGEEGKGIYARREVTYADHSFEPSTEEIALFSRPEREIEMREAMVREDDYWAENRLGSITVKENSVKDLMAQLRSNPVYYWTEKVLYTLFTGYIPTTEKQPKFYIGPMNATISGNTLEGVRLRAGGMTSAYLNPHLMAKGFVAYGTKDEKFKYLAELEYSFKKKKEYANEFPIHSLRFHSEYDVNQYGQHYLYTNKDNIFLMLKRAPNDQLGYEAKHEITYTHEYHSGFSWKATTRYRKNESTYLVPFLKNEVDGTLSPVRNIITSEMELNLRYAPNEKFIQTQWNRFPVSLDAPIFTLSHTIGAKDLLGSDYTYNHTEAGFQKRFWFSAFGYTDIILKAGKVWDKVPFPLLILPNANLSYTIQPESYALMDPMEFVNDEYVSWDVAYYLNGFVFNRIPVLKKLKWREVLSCRGLYGKLSDKNNPALTNGLFVFPDKSGVMGNQPYVEAGIGIENIFKVLRLDYVYRLTYRDQPHVDNDGIRISLHVTF